MTDRRRAVSVVLLCLGLSGGWAQPLLAADNAVLYTFDRGFKRDANGRRYVPDDSGNGRRAYLRTRDGGTIRLVTDRDGNGNAARYPSKCIGSGCPKAILQSGARGLNPGRRGFRYGATVRIRASETAKDVNVIQKGYWGRGGQYKLQVDGSAGRPACVVQGKRDGSRTSVKVPASVTIADGRWHRLVCVKRKRSVRIRVDGHRRGRRDARVGRVSSPTPLRVGGKDLSATNDQYFSVLDRMFLRYR